MGQFFKILLNYLYEFSFFMFFFKWMKLQFELRLIIWFCGKEIIKNFENMKWNNFHFMHILPIISTVWIVWDNVSVFRNILRPKPLVGVYINWKQNAQTITKCHIENCDNFIHSVYCQFEIHNWNENIFYFDQSKYFI